MYSENKSSDKEMTNHEERKNELWRKKRFTIKDVKRSKEGERRMISGSERESVNK